MTPDELLGFLTVNGFNALDFTIMQVTVSYMKTFRLSLPDNERWIDAGKLKTGFSLWVLAYHDTIEKIIENIANPEKKCDCSRCEEMRRYDKHE